MTTPTTYDVLSISKINQLTRTTTLIFMYEFLASDNNNSSVYIHDFAYWEWKVCCLTVVWNYKFREYINDYTARQGKAKQSPKYYKPTRRWWTDENVACKMICKLSRLKRRHVIPCHVVPSRPPICLLHSPSQRNVLILTQPKALRRVKLNRVWKNKKNSINKRYHQESYT